MQKSKGFTLIELLIVIVIIGILAGVLIVIINPAKQRNVAGDATIKSMINKIVLSTSGFVSAYGYAPNEAHFLGALETNITPFNVSSCVVSITPDYECLFKADSIAMPSTCTAGGWSGTTGDTDPCFFRYYSGSNLPQNSASNNRQFRIYGKSLGAISKIFVYDSLEGGQIFMCPFDILDSQTLASSCTSI